ncbi:MAG: hypothetical protein SGILL_003483 [Bacillariaceae sp.]
MSDWLAMIQIDVGTTWTTSQVNLSDNSKRLLGSLIRTKPREQIRLLVYQQAKAQQANQTQEHPLQLNPLFSSPNTIRSPSNTSFAATSPSKLKDDSSPKALLSMLEYYLLEFIRYPLAAPEVKTSTTQSSSSSSAYRVGHIGSSRSSVPYGDCVYYELFTEYVSYYVPVRASRGPFEGFSGLGRPSELFVRFIVAFWLESRNDLAVNDKTCAALRERRGANVSLDLCASYDLVKAAYSPLPKQVSRCFSEMVRKVVMDANIANLAERISRDMQERESQLLCLSPTMAILQLPFYNHVRNVFRHASVHSKDPTFAATMTDWLTYLEPWNTSYASTKKSVRSTMTRASKDRTTSHTRYIAPKTSQGSRYTPVWEAYIASNLHFYTVPLAIFLRRARELDFSPPFYKRSLDTVMKVLRVYSKDVVAVINVLLKERGSGGMDPSLSSNAPFARMMANHELNLGIYGPPKVPMSMSSLGDEMRNLLEEIHLQHLKNAEKLDVVERALSLFQGAFGSGTQKEEERDMKVLTKKAKVIFGLPDSYQVAPDKSKIRSNEFQSNRVGESERNHDGTFSASGRRHVSAGETKCRPGEVEYSGDRMDAKPQSYEISFLVPIFVNVSRALNDRFGLDSADKLNLPHFLPRRINLRFLADRRNLFLVILFITWLLRGLFS